MRHFCGGNAALLFQQCSIFQRIHGVFAIFRLLDDGVAHVQGHHESTEGQMLNVQILFLSPRRSNDPPRLAKSPRKRFTNASNLPSATWNWASFQPGGLVPECLHEGRRWDRSVQSIEARCSMD